ncbi:hypothetical protein PIB30_046398 [Stylosanthes scabra]|uniref:Uncharacterized protein n=1 Tax=Stylosanthes scabra TaxID=79078 RepID=A0ABU6SGA9_9FABA|nr:hypothetical protein [Stylosanthes scabra]
MVVEAEGSKVGETQQTPRMDGSNSISGSQNLGPTPVLNWAENGISPSPTKTTSLEDDRRTVQVIQERNEVLYRKPNLPLEGVEEISSPKDDCGGGHSSTGLGPNGDSQHGLGAESGNGEHDSSSLSAPLGFEKIISDKENNILETEVVRTITEKHTEKDISKHKRASWRRRMTLKLSDRIKENARRQKDVNRGNRHTREAIREEKELGLWQHQDDEIETSDDEVDGIWNIGTRLGLGANTNDLAKKYLKSKEEDIAEQRKERKNGNAMDKRKKGLEEVHMAKWAKCKQTGQEWCKIQGASATEKLKKMKVLLREWHKRKFGDMDWKIKLLEEEIAKLEVEIESGINVHENVKFKVLQRQGKPIRRRKSGIEEIFDRTRMVKDPIRVKIIARNYFKNLYSHNAMPHIWIQEGMLEKISVEEAVAIEVIPGDEEIRNAI